MNQKFLISIIIPVYKVEKYLRKCVDSVLAQTYQNIEVILVDDGSPDNCPQICDEYAKIDNRIKVIHKDNGGLSSARNAGIEIANGEFIGFLDSDDFICEDMYEILYNSLKQNDAQMSVCNFAYVNEEGVIQKQLNENMPIHDEVLSGEEALSKLCESKHWYYVTAINKLYRRELFDSIRFPLNKLHEDEFTAHRFFYACDKIAFVSDALYFYRQTPNSIMRSGCSIRHLDAVYAFLDRYCFYKEKELPNAKFSLILAYGILIDTVKILNIKKYKKEIFFAMCTVMKYLLIEKNLRVFKLILICSFKFLKDFIKE